MNSSFRPFWVVLTVQCVQVARPRKVQFIRNKRSTTTTVRNLRIQRRFYDFARDENDERTEILSQLCRTDQSDRFRILAQLKRGGGGEAGGISCGFIIHGNIS